MTATENLSTCRLRIDHRALANNWAHLNQQTGTNKTGAALKANAYGLGVREVATTLHKAGCQTFFVATAAEGAQVRGILSEARIFVFAGLNARNVSAYHELNLTPVLNSPRDIEVWRAHQRTVETRKAAGLFVDTGMNRLGMNDGELAQMADQADVMAELDICTVLSHLARADEPGEITSAEQLARFTNACRYFPNAEKSLANSAGIFLGEQYHFDLARPGIALYGAEHTPGKKLETVVHAEARILQLRSVPKGESVGYGATHILKRDSIIASVGIGYGDGYIRSGSGSGVATRKAVPTGALGAIENHTVPALGRISMDCTTFDVTDVPRGILEKAEWVELFGKHIQLDDLARAAGTIGYEILTSLGQRYDRQHLNFEEIS